MAEGDCITEWENWQTAYQAYNDNQAAYTSSLRQVRRFNKLIHQATQPEADGTIPEKYQEVRTWADKVYSAAKGNRGRTLDKLAGGEFQTHHMAKPIKDAAASLMSNAQARRTAFEAREQLGLDVATAQVAYERCIRMQAEGGTDGGGGGIYAPVSGLRRP